ncbi:MAG TPA: hypothetical protein VI757_12900 [Bacteroidia bacterium]|nr:hypothetical protein [Bacteroidia bacterium]
MSELLQSPVKKLRDRFINYDEFSIADDWWNAPEENEEEKGKHPHFIYSGRVHKGATFGRYVSSNIGSIYTQVGTSSEPDEKKKDFNLVKFLYGLLGKIKQETVVKDKELQKELTTFSELKEDWDGYGALTPLKETIANTNRILSNLPPIILESISDLYPNPHGTISLELTNKKDEIVSIEIGKKTYSFFSKFSDKELVTREKIPLDDTDGLLFLLGQLLILSHPDRQ